MIKSTESTRTEERMMKMADEVKKALENCVRKVHCMEDQ